MILRITVGDNDFTEELEQFASDLELYAYTRKLGEDNCSIDTLYNHIKSIDRFRELFYQTDKYTPELATELCTMIQKHWEIWVTYCMKNHDWWTEEDATRIKSYLIRDFKVKFQKSLTPKWHNGEVVYICCGYYNRWWTF
jgi:hypothetical protein